jgi:beta-glucosidase
VRGTVEGRLIPPVGVGHPFGKGTFADFFGVNYYTRDRVRFVLNPRTYFGELRNTPGASENELGWELYPEGLYRVCRRYYLRYRIPIFITENGICDAHDVFRSRYIYDHLAQIRRLLDEEIVVNRYYHWTLMDNFEWLEGLSARFGLIHVDFQTQKRTMRESGRFYSEVCEKKSVTEAMLRRYLGREA